LARDVGKKSPAYAYVGGNWGQKKPKRKKVKRNYHRYRYIGAGGAPNGKEWCSNK